LRDTQQVASRLGFFEHDTAVDEALVGLLRILEVGLHSGDCHEYSRDRGQACSNAEREPGIEGDPRKATL